MHALMHGNDSRIASIVFTYEQVELHCPLIRLYFVFVLSFCCEYAAFSSYSTARMVQL